MTTPTHPQQVAKSASAKKMLMSDLMQTVGILPILILIVAVFGFIAPNFFTESNLLNITRQASINIVLAAGMTFIILTGGIDLSVGSILGTTAVAAMVVSLISEFAMLSIPAALMLGMVLGLVFKLIGLAISAAVVLAIAYVVWRMLGGRGPERLR